MSEDGGGDLGSSTEADILYETPYLSLEWQRVVIILFISTSFFSILCNLAVVTQILINNRLRDVFKNMQQRPVPFMTLFLCVLNLFNNISNMLTVLSLVDILSGNTIVCSIQGYVSAFFRLWELTSASLFCYLMWRSLVTKHVKDPYEGINQIYKFVLILTVILVAFPSVTVNYGYSEFGWCWIRRNTRYYSLWNFFSFGIPFLAMSFADIGMIVECFSRRTIIKKWRINPLTQHIGAKRRVERRAHFVQYFLHVIVVLFSNSCWFFFLVIDTGFQFHQRLPPAALIALLPVTLGNLSGAYHVVAYFISNAFLLPNHLSEKQKRKQTTTYYWSSSTASPTEAKHATKSTSLLGHSIIIIKAKRLMKKLKKRSRSHRPDSAESSGNHSGRALLPYGRPSTPSTLVQVASTAVAEPPDDDFRG